MSRQLSTDTYWVHLPAHHIRSTYVYVYHQPNRVIKLFRIIFHPMGSNLERELRDIRLNVFFWLIRKSFRN